MAIRRAPTGVCVLQSGGPLAKPSVSLKAHRADHHAYDYFSAFAEALALEIHLSYQCIAPLQLHEHIFLHDGICRAVHGTSLRLITANAITLCPWCELYLYISILEEHHASIYAYRT